MAIFKCKMCGGDLHLEAGVSVATCEYCGTQQTVPAADDEKKLTLFARANRLRIGCEFDKASGVYESIVADFPEEAEAYWGLVLCRYGIEYVDDPATLRKIPTCHRSSFDSVMDDRDLEQALENADPTARRLYREEAKAIEELRRGIIEVSGKEEPYDVFICYKETDESNQRTIDSVIAQDVYDALTDKGYRVFFSRISLEDKLGQEYEPYIFAALNSAKVMLAFGTDYEYYNAVWVKNEWSRFLKLMGTDKEKHLIPCYKGIDAYDMPKEFAKLQAQDMGKVGAIQDLLRGIEKLFHKQVEQTANVEQSQGSVGVESLLKRAVLALEDQNWAGADAFCEQVLNAAPECAQAYLYKLMAELHVREEERLKCCTAPFANNNLTQKAIRFGDENLKKRLSAYVQDNLVVVYNQAKVIADSASDEAKYQEAAELFEAISGYNDADKLAMECRRKAAVAKGRAEEAEKTAKHEQKVSVITLVSVVAAIVCFILFSTVIAPSNQYSRAVSLLKNGSPAEAYELFEALGDYKDSKQMAKESKYDEAMQMLESGTNDALAVLAAFDKAGDYEDAREHAAQLRRNLAGEKTLSAGLKYTVGVRANGSVVIAGWSYDGQNDVITWSDIQAVSAGDNHVVGLTTYGSVMALGVNEDGRCDVDDWFDIVAVSAGGTHTVGIKGDGSVVATGSNASGQCNVSGWRNIVAVAAAGDFTVGLKADGTLVAVGNVPGDVSRFTEVAAISAMAVDDERSLVILKTDGTVDALDAYYSYNHWTDIVAVSAGQYYALGLKRDGTVVFEGFDDIDVSGWRNIVAISAGPTYAVGLKADGTVVAAGNDTYGQGNVYGWSGIKEVATGWWSSLGLKEDGTAVSSGYNFHLVHGWNNLVAVDAGSHHMVGLKSDGTAQASGGNEYGQCDVYKWQDLVAITAGNNHTVGLKKDGTVVAIGDNELGQCNVSGWRDIVAVSAWDNHTVGLKKDGTVVAVGNNEYGQCNVSGWWDIVQVDAGENFTMALKSDGTVVAVGNNSYNQNVSSWRNIVKISAGRYHAVGLKANGTVVAFGSHNYGLEEVTGWTDIESISAGNYFTVGLKKDGTVVAAGNNNNGQCNVFKWTNIKMPTVMYT